MGIKKSKFNIEYKIVDIDILKFSLSEIEGFNLDHDNILIGIGISGDYNKEDSILKNTLLIEIVKENEKGSSDDTETISTLKISVDFLVENLDISEEGKGVLVPKDLLVKLAGLTISTGRGIIFTKFQGTIIEGLVLPIIDDEMIAKQLFSDDD